MNACPGMIRDSERQRPPCSNGSPARAIVGSNLSSTSTIPLAEICTEWAVASPQYEDLLLEGLGQLPGAILLLGVRGRAGDAAPEATEVSLMVVNEGS